MAIARKAPKSNQVSFRVTDKFKDVLSALAERENRSQANMLEVAIFHYAELTGVEVPVVKAKASKKKAASKR